MSMFDKVFAKVGIGSASVDTKLEKDAYMPGETVRGVVEIKGGKIDQQIDDITLSLNTNYMKESNDRKYSVTYTIDRFRITNPFTIGKNDSKVVAFSFQLPIDTPLAIGKSRIWLSTGLDIKNAVDPNDKDYFKVIPNSFMNAVINAIDNLGFRLREVECQEASRHFRGRFPFVQEFEFVPISGPFKGKLDELELTFRPLGDDVMELLFQVDRRPRGLGGLIAEAAGMDETNVRLTISFQDIANIQEKIYRLIQQYS